MNTSAIERVCREFIERKPSWVACELYGDLTLEFGDCDKALYFGRLLNDMKKMLPDLLEEIDRLRLIGDNHWPTEVDFKEK